MYRKRFHKKRETELTVLAPRREQLTGDEAHDRVRAMLDETVDIELWQAQRVLQSASTAAVDLSGCDALSRALDVAAGRRVRTVRRRAPAGRPHRRRVPALLHPDRPSHRRMGRRHQRGCATPTTRWRACAAAVAEVDDAVRRHAELTDASPPVRQQVEAAERHAAPNSAAAEVGRLRDQLREASWSPTAAAATARAASAAASTERRRLRDRHRQPAATMSIVRSRDRGSRRGAVSRPAGRADGGRAASSEATAALEAAEHAVDPLAASSHSSPSATKLIGLPSG